MMRLLEENQQRALAFAWGLTRDSDKAQELVQEAGLKVLRCREAYDPERPFSAWYLTIVKNLFLDMRRKSKSQETLSLDGFIVADGDLSLKDSLPDNEPSQEKRLEKEEISREILRAFSEIPSHHQKILTLCVIEGQDYAEAAKKTGVSIGTVKSRLSRAKAGFLSRIKNKGEITR